MASSPSVARGGGCFCFTGLRRCAADAADNAANTQAPRQGGSPAAALPSLAPLRPTSLGDAIGSKVAGLGMPTAAAWATAEKCATDASLPTTCRSSSASGASADTSLTPLESISWSAGCTIRSDEAADESGILNGFVTIPELEPIRVALHNIAPFSLPQEALSFTPDANAVVARFANGDSERMIFCCTPLEEHEQRWLSQCREETRHRGLALMPSFTVAAGRFVGDEKGNHKKAIDRIEAAQGWRLNFFRDGPITDPSVETDLAMGAIYFCGRDRMLRPALVVRPARVPASFIDEKCAEKFNRAFLFCMEYFLKYMIVPGKVENVCVVIDLKGMRLSQVPPWSALMQIKTVLSQQNAGRVFRFYICNMPWVLRAVSSLVQAAMTERQQQKIVFVHDFARLRAEFASQQLETDFGGSAPIATRFLPFPLPPGPFEPSSSVASTAAVPNVHRALAPGASLGRLWDSARSRQWNERIDLATTAEAKDILARCGVRDEMPAAPQAASSPAQPHQHQQPTVAHNVAPAGSGQSRQRQRRPSRGGTPKAVEAAAPEANALASSAEKAGVVAESMEVRPSRLWHCGCQAPTGSCSVSC